MKSFSLLVSSHTLQVLNPQPYPPSHIKEGGSPSELGLIHYDERYMYHMHIFYPSFSGFILEQMCTTITIYYISITKFHTAK